MASREELDVRRAVRETLSDVTSGTVLVACSGGPDSLALASATVVELGRSGLRPGAVTVDHGLQDGSATRSRRVAGILVSWGFDPVEVIYAPVVSSRAGPEGNARMMRYAALDGAAVRHGAAAILLGHTRDDQAETVVLGLARGSGARSLAGMPPLSGRYRRPLLRLSRSTVRAAVPSDIAPWDDPHNADASFRRARVRHDVLPVLDKQLGPGISDALARSADLLRADADALDGWADRVYAEASIGPCPPGGRPVVLDVEVLADVPSAVRTRVLRRAALTAGSPPSDLTAEHVWAVESLVTNWHGQGPIDLPGKVRAARTGRPATIRVG
ncbi:MAG TPA: tRNA lysidine(34) synthetase TilS [Jiangellaceae bacterium]